MTCRVALCAVCRMAGLEGCPFRGATLPLAEAGQPKVYTKNVVYPPQSVAWDPRFSLWKPK